MKRTKARKNFLPVIIASLIVAAGFLFALFRPTTPNISMIGNPIPVPLPTTTSTCISNIVSFKLATGCGTNMVKRVDVLCKDGRSSYESSTDSCVDPVGAFSRAQTYCGQTCATSPSPTMAPTSIPVPTPVPTIIPRPTTTASPTPLASACWQQLSSWTYRQSCLASPSSYRYLDYRCSGSPTTFTIGGPTSCKTEATWVSEARANCAHTACTPSPLPTATVMPSPVTKPAPITSQRCLPWKMFGWSYCSGRWVR